jgi:hypothetical protein
MKSNTQTKSKKLMRPQLAIFGIILAICVIGGIALAKYTRKESDQGIVRAKWFYFNSDLLKEGTSQNENNTYTYASRTPEITFKLMSREDELRYSEMDIHYTVKVEKKVDNIWQNVGEAQIGTIKEKNSDDATITIKSNELGENDGLNGSYKITATGYCGTDKAKGYEKTLTAYINTSEELEVNPKLYYYVDDNTDEKNDPHVVLLTVYAEGYTGKVTIAYPDTLIPDNTDERMANAKTGSSIEDNVTFQETGYHSHTYRFFMSDTDASRNVSNTGATIDGESFTVTGENIEASYKKPDETE